MLTERSARVVAAVKLHRHVARKREQRFLAEGPNLIESAIRRGQVVEVFATESAAQRHGELLASAPAPVHPITDRAAKALSDTVTPAGLVAVCALPEPDMHELLSDAPQLVVVAVGIGEPGNAGTLIRIADATGAGVVVLTGNSVDPYNGKCLRASAGSIFNIPVVVAADTDAVLVALREAGLQVLATALDGDLCLDDADPVLVAPTAWLFGPEAQGLPAAAASAADHRVRIPMSGGAESLNVAAAAAICLYQSARAQRGARS
jgi:TrmH family RNA methyltransferase